MSPFPLTGSLTAVFRIGNFVIRGGNKLRDLLPQSEEEQLTEDSKKLEQHKPFKEPIVTEIAPASRFHPAEEHHQNFYQKNPHRDKFYKFNCDPVQRLKEVWGHHS